MKTTSVRLVSSIVAFVAMSSCATMPELASGRVAGATDDKAFSTPQPDSQSTETVAGNAGDRAESANESRSNISLGTGAFVQAARGSRANVYATDEGVTLNFEQADLREFLRVVFETILRENYLIHPKVRGTVTLHTTRPVTRNAILPILETVLQGNGAALVRDEGIFKIMPMADAETVAGAPAVGRYASTRTTGYGIQVVPLEHVAAGRQRVTH
jgi:general secretion pathway protein D